MTFAHVSSLALFSVAALGACVASEPPDDAHHDDPALADDRVAVAELSADTAAAAGTTERLLRTDPPKLPAFNTGGAFRIATRWTHIAKDDPIVFPNQPGKSHLHMFFGNARVDAATTRATIRRDCQSASAGGTVNCSGYWIPALLDAANRVIPARESLVYYKAGAGTVGTPEDYRAQIVTPPAGLRFIGGDPTASPSTLQSHVYFECSADESLDARRPYIVPCPQGAELRAHLSFPTCWNGQLDSADHRSHVVYPGRGGCPSTHPKILPNISFVFLFPVTSARGTAGWHASSDGGITPHGAYSFHGDWMNGWDQAVLDDIVSNCLRAPGQGNDCHANLVGDGRWLERP
jgi:Domain of unknown function (DUF1996)